ncbi:isopentenyl-diphosphate delta-isomerase [Micromonospora rosaria]|uniref:Isopentenyl-diphosphate Delta-isomerase n=1 Tax=Micromonospora rosaria TaxID=47874 RepID=A0A136PWR0_9ACTN|nr:isopentenyl-diphosphate delta-isomerase [Micromonospora rosaria]
MSREGHRGEPSSREGHLVELVDHTGRALGKTTVSAAHQPPGQLHRAFSVLLTDAAGRVLLQRRAEVKTRFPLRWANSCCGHPEPGEAPATAANRRLGEELGVGPVDLTEVGVYVYYAEDPVTGRVEYEYDHVLRGELPADAPVRPDPAEVAELRWANPAAVAADLAADPQPYAPWLGGVLDRLLRPTAQHGPAADHAPARSAGETDDGVEPSGGR